MASLIFDEKSMIEGNLFQYEGRLKSSTSRFLAEGGGGAVLTTYYQIKENATTVIRGLSDIEELFGHKSPLRFNKIKNFPLYGFNQINPSNTDEQNTEDINAEGECVILPSTIVPNPNDFFTINHLKMKGFFQVIDVQYDSMKVEGYYKIRYRLHSTSIETLNNLERQSMETFHTELDSIGTNINPIIREDDFILRSQIQQMVNQMIFSYRSMFYNERHNCFLFLNQSTGVRWFDLCGNEFMAKNSIMNPTNSSNVIILHDKIRDEQFPFYYNNSIYSWLELGAPRKLLQKFHFQLSPAEYYRDSSFYRWSEGDIGVIQPLATHQVGINNQELSFFDERQFDSLLDDKLEPSSEFENLLFKFVNRPQSLSIQDVSLDTADTLIKSIRHMDVFLYTPIAIYIIRKILRLN